MSARLFPVSAQFATGLVGTAGYTVTDAAGAVLAVRTTSGITESPAGSGYYIANAALDSSWTGWIDLDDGSGTVEKWGFQGTTPPTGTVAPQPRRPFQFVHRLGSPSVLTDAASVVMSDPTNTFGARDLATGVIVVPNNTPMTRVALGSYFWDVVEPGGNIEWYAKVTETALNGGGTFAYPFTSLDPSLTVRYAERPDVEAEIGVDNTRVYADRDSDGDATKIAANIESGLTVAYGIIDKEIAGWGYALPLTAVSGALPAWVTNNLRLYAQKIGAWQLGQGRDHTQVNPDAARKDLQNRYDWAMAQLTDMLENGIPAVKATVGSGPLNELFALSPASGGLNTCGTTCGPRLNHLMEPVLTP